MISEAELRAINLMESLAEAAAAEGREVPEPPERAVAEWSEDRIRAHYAAAPPPPTSSVNGDGAPGIASHPPAAIATNPEALAPLPPSPAAAAARAAAAAAAAASPAFAAWFPGLRLSRTQKARPRLRVLAFHPAGCAEDVYTSEGSGARRTASPLLEYCRAHGAELLAAQPPGRGARTREAPMTSLQRLAAELLGVVRPLLEDGVPYVLIGHSMGAWAAYELAAAARDAGAPTPVHAFLSGMPGPDLPAEQRPWAAAGGRRLADGPFQAHAACGRRRALKCRCAAPPADHLTDCCTPPLPFPTHRLSAAPGASARRRSRRPTGRPSGRSSAPTSRCSMSTSSGARGSRHLASPSPPSRAPAMRA